MKRVSVGKLYEFACKALMYYGMNAGDAEVTARTLVTTDTFGVLSHGTKNLCQYIQKIQAGGIDPKAKPAILREGPAWAILDGKRAMGMVSACRGMELAVEKARKTGIAYVGVRNSCHFGAAGYYANLAAAQGMIGIAMSNADPNMAIPGSRDVAIGNNPFSFAVPVRSGESIFLDIALSNVAALKVVMAKERGEQVPLGWLIDDQGVPTTDPSGFPYDSHLLPMAAHKGYGLAVMVESLAGLLTGAGMLGEVSSWNLNLASPNNAGHAFIAIDCAQMMPPERFGDRVEQMARELHDAPKGQGTEKIFLPGEMEWAKRRKALEEDAIELTQAMADSLIKLSGMCGIPLE
jgi:LDH2 family malate/lactate/ureidoglycolate dehydrogenase